MRIKKKAKQNEVKRVPARQASNLLNNRLGVLYFTYKQDNSW